ncbi:hypothetical protein [Desulfosarcina sp.]|uniref:hypothetical protein n=1 Tax=Desulfosarcina sp. TaxID=2027861 RepID=UPI003970AC68
MAWHTIRSFGATDYQAVMRHRDALTQSFRFRVSTSCAITAEMRKKDKWYVGGWKLHLSIYPGDYSKTLPALRLFEERMAPSGLVYKYAASKRLYESFVGEVKGKFATIYCKSPMDITPIVYLVNQLFTQEGITPVSRHRIGQLDGLKHELPLLGGYGFVRYGAFCFTKGILDLTDAQRSPMPDSRQRPFPSFKDPARLEGEMAAFKELIVR